MGRSKCPHCTHTLQTKDLIPLLSFCIQKGKCRYCHKKLSWRYPILEGSTALIFLVSYLVLGHTSLRLTMSVAVGAWLLLIIFLYDIFTYELHRTATLLLLIISLFGQWILGYNLWSAIQYGIIFFIIFLVIYGVAKCYASRKYQPNTEGFGFGDVIRAGVGGTMISVVMPSVLREQINMICMYLVLSCCL
ncbi:MAG: prepilin peptidase [Candidatus Peribacteria bacterium]|nr:prepilin peptidase [Candidatus Peribacteria bacterium]